MESAGRRMKVDVPDDAPLHGRPDDLRDMLRNLLDNARIHGRGAVSVTMHRYAETSRQLLVLEVCDEGSGVPPGREEAGFDRFCKLDAAAPGAGLGLAIVRQVARSHGGEARFAAGRGCVVVTLPATEQPATKPESVPPLPA
jgi:two-component system sensor histidine kinase QseC